MNTWLQWGSRHLRWLLLILPVALSACAPQTVLVKRYESPVDASGQACLKTCEDELAACQARCKAERDACEAGAEARARENLPKALDDYSAALERYRIDLLFWRLDNWHGGLFYSPYYPRWSPFFYYGYDWYEPPPMPPAGPPTLASEIARARAACRRDCGCQGPYEACFLRCGGRIIEEERPVGSAADAPAQ